MMHRAALLLACMAVTPQTAAAQSDATAMLDFMESHCLRPFAARDMHNLPDGWRRASDGATRAALPNVAIEEAAGYATFAAAQNDGVIDDPNGRWWPLIDQAYTEELSDVRSFTRRGWYALFVHTPSGTHMIVDSGLYAPDDAVDDWESSACWLWHPDPDAPLNAAILDRWDIGYGDRIPSHVGHMLSTFLQPAEFEGFEDNDLSINVGLTQPNRDYDPALAAVVLRLEVIDWR